jgi:hypothetical protein
MIVSSSRELVQMEKSGGHTVGPLSRRVKGIFLFPGEDIPRISSLYIFLEFFALSFPGPGIARMEPWIKYPVLPDGKNIAPRIIRVWGDWP